MSTVTSRSGADQASRAPQLRTSHGVRRLPIGRAAALLGLSLVLAGCGGDDEPAKAKSAAASPEAPAIQAVSDAAFKALQAGDGAAFCDLLAPDSLKILVAGAKGKGTVKEKCATITTKIAKQSDTADLKPQKIEDIKVDGDLAEGTVSGRVTQFERVDGKWYIGTSQDAATTPASTSPAGTTPATTP